MAPVEDLLDQGKADEFFPEKHGEDLMGEYLLDDRPEIAMLPFETILIFSKEPLEIIKEHPIKNRVFWMALVVNPCHGREDDS
jgi:hypothetical protein